MSMLNISPLFDARKEQARGSWTWSNPSLFVAPHHHTFPWTWKAEEQPEKGWPEKKKPQPITRRRLV